MCVLMCDCPPCPFSPLSPVLAELQQADLITSKECEGMDDPSDVVEVQRGKSPEVQAKTANVFRTHGFEEESNFLAGKQTQPLMNAVRLSIMDSTLLCVLVRPTASPTACTVLF